MNGKKRLSAYPRSLPEIAVGDIVAYAQNDQWLYLVVEIEEGSFLKVPFLEYLDKSQSDDIYEAYSGSSTVSLDKRGSLSCWRDFIGVTDDIGFTGGCTRTNESEWAYNPYMAFSHISAIRFTEELNVLGKREFQTTFSGLRHLRNTLGEIRNRVRPSRTPSERDYADAVALLEEWVTTSSDPELREIAKRDQLREAIQRRLIPHLQERRDEDQAFKEFAGTDYQFADISRSDTLF